MNTVLLENKLDARDTPAPAMSTTTPAPALDPPAGWPLQLQVAIAFWLVTGTVLTLAVSSGVGWLLALIPIAADYAWYLRTDRGLTVELLLDASWNRSAGVPSRYAPQESWRDALPTLPQGKSEAFRLQDLDIAEMLRDAHDETLLRLRAAHLAINSRITATRRRLRLDPEVDKATTSHIDESSGGVAAAPTTARAPIAWRDAA